jgi:NUMOD4 motif/HNH endonuclease
MPSLNEQFKPIVGWEDRYEVSSLGRIVSYCRGKSFKKLTPTKDGYLIVTLCRDGRTETELVSRLVAKAFVPNPSNRPDVNHEDGHKHNNRADNLEWVTKLENNRHAIRMGLTQINGSDNPNARLSSKDILRIRKSKKPLRRLARIFGVHFGHIWNIQKRKRWAHVRDEQRRARK